MMILNFVIGFMLNMLKKTSFWVSFWLGNFLN